MALFHKITLAEVDLDHGPFHSRFDVYRSKRFDGTDLVQLVGNGSDDCLGDQDRLMGRTRARPLPEGRLSPEAALVFGTALACASLPLLRP